jgi:cytochrome c-type biogenesis protein CcmH
MIDPIAALRGQLQLLQTRQASGAIGKKEYEQEKARLERALLDLVLAAPASPPIAAAVRPPARLVAGLSAAVLVLAVAGYAWTGSPSLITGKVPVAQAESSPHQASGSAEEFEAAVERLAGKLKEQPDNAEGWVMLARSYLQMGRVAEALPAFEKALALDGNNARLLVDYADALAVKNDRNLEGQPMMLIERALKIEPDNLKGLALAGTAAFNRKDYAGAVRYWEKLAAAAPPESPWREQVKGGIAEARSLGGMAPAATAPAPIAAAPVKPAPAATPGAPAAPAAPAVASTGTGVSGTVRLAASVATQAAPNDTVFVLARAAEGPRMPLAIVRTQVKDLPLAFKLDDAMAMSPEMRLSKFPKIVIDARVSKSGQAQPGPGDLAGRSAPIANNATGVVIEINEVVKN